MKQLLGVYALLFLAASCQCGPPPEPCDGTKCGPGLVCAPATGKCVSTTEDGGARVDSGVPDDGGLTGDGGLDAGACPTACTGATPFCDVAGQRCVGCVSGNDCTAVTPFCLPATSTCVECRNLLDCPNARDCDLASHTCLPEVDGGTGGGGGSSDAVVYGHTGNTLYKVNATTKVVTRVADFQHCDAEVIDLALDEYSRAFVTTSSGLFRLDLATANCTEVNWSPTETYPNSLSFVPRGTLDPSIEALVGYSGSSYVRIDPNTGAMQQVGTLGGGFVSSGDIVSVIDGGTYLTVKDPSSSTNADYLVEVNPATGGLVRSFGPLSFNDVYGLAFWGGRLYGFSNAGTLFEITINGTGTNSAPVPNAMSQTWNGAGSTTAARIR